MPVIAARPVPGGRAGAGEIATAGLAGIGIAQIRVLGPRVGRIPHTARKAAYGAGRRWLIGVKGIGGGR